MSPGQEIAPGVSLPAQDSTAPDSVSALGEIGAEVRELGELFVEGEWTLAWQRTSETVMQGAIEFLPRLLSALFVGALFYGVYRVVFRLASRVFRTKDRSSSSLRDLVLNAIRFLGWSLIALVALEQLGLNITAAVAGLGILGLALGFAAKDSLENFLAGVTIIMDRPFDVGDVVEVQGTYGTVTRFTLRSTRIRTPQRRVLVMPNVSMINQPLLNHSGHRFIRVDVDFGIAYKEDIAAARRAVLDAVPEDDERLLERLDPEVIVTELADSSVNMQLRLFVEDASEELPIRWEYVERVREALREAGIEIPFPHLQLFIDEAKAFENEGLSVRPEHADES